MRNSWSSIGRGDQAVNTRVIPPLKPFPLIKLALGIELPDLVSGLRMPVPQESSPYSVSSNILDPKVMQVLHRSRKAEIEAHLGSTSVVPLSPTKEGFDSLEAVAAEKD
jgi:hypothetical protein